MLVNPEVSALLNRLSKSERDAPKNGPRITRGEKSGKGGLDKPKDVLAYDHEETAERKDDVDYLNERESKVSCYA